MPLYDVASLWIGPELTWMEQMCLMSFVEAGHTTTLYSYEPVRNVPDGVVVKDANDIMPTNEIIYHVNTGSPAFHADIFKLRMLAQTNYLWIDTDAYCLKPFKRPKHGYFYGWGTDRRKIISSGVLGLPKKSKTLAAMLELTSDLYPIPPWYPAKKREELHKLKSEGNGVHMSLLPWGVIGPEALHCFTHQTGEAKYALEGHVLYPMPFSNVRAFHRPHLKKMVTASIHDDTISVHFYGRRFRNIFALSKGLPLEDSYADDLCKKHGIDPSETAHLFVRKEQ